MKKRAFKKRLKSANCFNYELVLFWDRINDLILMGCWQKWPEPVIDCLLDLASFFCTLPMSSGSGFISVMG